MTVVDRRVLSINTSRAQAMTIDDRRVMTGILKRPVSTLQSPERIDVRPLGLDQDEQADPTVHGGLSKAVYAYPHEHYPFWQTVRSQAQAQAWDDVLPHGMLGENLTITGLLESDAYIGDVLKFSNCTLAISEPRRPCYKLAAVMGFNQAVKMMAQSGYCGFYLAVRVPGTIAAGESYELIPGQREVNIAELFKSQMRKRLSSQ